MKAKKLLYGTVLVSTALIIPVPLVDIIVSLISAPQDITDTAAYPLKQIIVGIISESISAVITCYLYFSTVNKGSSIMHGIKFGMLYSALIASLYIILGGFYFELKDPFRFVVMDSLILLIQGFTSGIALYYSFRR